jgi:ketosteroid isomerase-like protein
VSRENVEVVRELARAYSSQDWEGLARVYDPGVVMHHLEGWPEPGPTVGREAVVEQWKTIVDAVGSGESIEESVWARGEWVVAHFRLEVTGIASGIDVDTRYTFVYRVRNGLITEQRNLWGHVDPLEAVGLQE